MFQNIDIVKHVIDMPINFRAGGGYYKNIKDREGEPF
jgi:hypothetical protein